MPALNTFMSPFMMWNQLAWKAGEMAISSAQVIGRRSSRMWLSGPVPSAIDQREFSLMVREKGEAAMESAQAMGARAFAVSQQFATLAFRQWLSANQALQSIAASRTPAESVERQARLVRDSMTGSVAVASKLSGATARIAHGAIRPLHKRVKSNAKRLGKR